MSIVIITSLALVVIASVLIYNYRVSLGKKAQVLEDLRQGLLYDNEGRDLDTINEAYIQSLQQGLILKDASVKFNEIQIEKQVGEGSFGVVYKATFRGASVAVKRMRAMFSELTNHDIEVQQGSIHDEQIAPSQYRAGDGHFLCEPRRSDAQQGEV